MPKAKSQNYQHFPGIRLTEADLVATRDMLNKGKWSARVLKRARVLQLLDKGWRLTQITEATGMYPANVRRIGYRYLEGGLDKALHEAPRPGAARLLDKRQETAVVAMVCGAPPSGRARWSVRLVADEAVARGIVATVGRETIRQVLNEHEMKPWRKKNVVRP